MCMTQKKPNVVTPAPTPTVQTDDATTTTGDEWYSTKKKRKAGADSTILASATIGKNTLGG